MSVHHQVESGSDRSVEARVLATLCAKANAARRETLVLQLRGSEGNGRDLSLMPRRALAMR